MNSDRRATKLARTAKRGRGDFLNHERRVLLMSLAAGAPAITVALVLLWTNDYSQKVCWTLTCLLVFCWLGFSFAARARVMRPLQTIANLLAALGEGDYSIRARGGDGKASGGDVDALGEVLREVNELSETLRRQRVGALEANALLRTVMSEIDVAVFAFDEENRLRLVNRAGERLLAQPAERITGRTVAQLDLAECVRAATHSNLINSNFINNKTRDWRADSRADDNNGADNNAPPVLRKKFAGSQNERWGVRRNSFRLHGRPHELLVLADLSRPLREEERAAWQRLVRVLGHELNNSLAPIRSIAGSLATLVAREPRPADWQADVESGLRVVSTRAESLSRFMEAYARVARLPAPARVAVRLDELVRRVVQLEVRLRAEVVTDEKIDLLADADQLEQLLINVLRNAVDAALATEGEAGRVRVGWRKINGQAEVWVEDEGLGIANAANLFVPFFTTKPEGTGIGLVLSRQIAEAHGGALTLENRKDRAGCIARLRLPLRDSATD